MAEPAQHWGDALLRHCPPSLRGLYSRAHQTLSDFVDALGAELARLDTRSDEALEELYPDSATETLGAWETQLGVTPAAGATTAERRAALGAKFRAQGGCNPAYIKGVCEGFGYAVGDVDILEPASDEPAFRAGVGRCGDSIGGGYAHAHSFLVVYPLPVNATMEAFIREIAPAHTWPFFLAV